MWNERSETQAIIALKKTTIHVMIVSEFPVRTGFETVKRCESDSHEYKV